MTAAFPDRLEAAIRAKHAPVVVGIDPIAGRLPAALRSTSDSPAAACEAIGEFCRILIDAVAPIAPAVKINSAFFEVYREQGVALFYSLIAHAHERGLLVIADVKRGDIGSTAALYARGHLSAAGLSREETARIPDAVTIAGYLGESAVRAFADIAREEGRGLYVLVRPSDPGADRIHEFGEGRKLYEHLAALVSEWGAAADLIGDCGLSAVGAVVAPKDATSTSALRAAMPHTPWLVPGYGAQGGTAADCAACFRSSGDGAIVNASRSVIYAFEKPQYAEQHGGDWQACIAAAAADFAKEIASCVSGN